MSVAQNVAFLTGITIIGSAAMASEAAANSIVLTDFFDLNGGAHTLTFASFNPLNGSLDSVAIDMTSTLANPFIGEGFVSASVSVDGQTLASVTGSSSDSSTPFDLSTLFLSPPSVFTCNCFFDFLLKSDNSVLPGSTLGKWVGNLKVTYNYTPTASPVPLPAAFPLLASALGGLGLAARKRRKKATN